MVSHKTKKCLHDELQGQADDFMKFKVMIKIISSL